MVRSEIHTFSPRECPATCPTSKCIPHFTVQRLLSVIISEILMVTANSTTWPNTPIFTIPHYSMAKGIDNQIWDILTGRLTPNFGHFLFFRTFWRTLNVWNEIKIEKCASYSPLFWGVYFRRFKVYKSAFHDSTNLLFDVSTTKLSWWKPVVRTVFILKEMDCVREGH